VKATGVQIFHLNELLQFVVDYIEDAMPLTPTLKLTGINTVLSADKRDTNVPTSIVFAKLGSIALFVGKRAVENAAPRKSPKAGLFHCAWKSRNRSGISTFSTAPATTG
jgi:hypothetical protein